MADFELMVNSEKMRDICEKIRFGGGEAVTVGFSEDSETGKKQLMLLASDEIVQAQGFVPVDVKGEEEALFMSSILLDDVRQISNYGKNIRLSFSDGSCRITSGTAKMSCPIMNSGKRIELPQEELAEGLAVSVRTDNFRHALNVGGVYAEAESNLQVYNKSVCFTFHSGDDGYNMRMCSSISGSFSSYSSCAVTTDDATGAQLAQKQYVLKYSHLKALLNCVDDEEIIIVFGKTHIWIKDSNAAYIITMLSGAFNKVLLDLYDNEQYDVRFGMNRKELISAIDCVMTGRKEINNIRASVWFKIDGSKMAVESCDEEQKVELEEFAIEDVGGFEQLYDAAYLKKLLLVFSSEKIMMRAVKNREIMMLYVSDNEKDLAVMLPVKPNTKKDNEKSDEKPKKASEKTGGKKKK